MSETRTRVGSAALLLCLGGFGLTACGSDSTTSSGGSSSASPSIANCATGNINAAGSSAQKNAIDTWVANYQQACAGSTINYQSVGSGAGIQSFNQGSIAFAGSDSALKVPDEQNAANKRCSGGQAINLPMVAGPIAVAYNLSGVSGLILDAPTMADIFATKITKWNDPAIAKENPCASLPDTTITPVHRSDSSGTSANFTDFLSQAAPSDWSYGSVEDWPIKSGEGASGTSGVIQAVGAGDGTIGYADNSQAGSLGKVSVIVGGKATAPSAAAAAAVLSQSSPVGGSRPATDLAVSVNRTPTGSGVYPVILVSYQIFCQKQSSSTTAATLKAFETYVVSSEGQQAAAKQAGSAPLPSDVAAKALTAINTITG